MHPGAPERQRNSLFQNDHGTVKIFDLKKKQQNHLIIECCRYGQTKFRRFSVWKWIISLSPPPFNCINFIWVNIPFNQVTRQILRRRLYIVFIIVEDDDSQFWIDSWFDESIKINVVFKSLEIVQSSLRHTMEINILFWHFLNIW